MHRYDFLDDKTIKVGGHDLPEGSRSNVENQLNQNSPMSEYIKSVEFVELPGSPKLGQGFSGLKLLPSLPTREVSTSQSHSRVEITPLKSSDNEQNHLQDQASKTVELSSIWMDDNLVESEECLIMSSHVMSSELALSNEGLLANNNVSPMHQMLEADSQFTVQVGDASSQQHDTLTFSGESQVNNGSVSGDKELGASALPGSSSCEGIEAFDSEPVVNTNDTPESKSKQSAFSKSSLSVVKIKRAFSAIISPPGKNKAVNEGPQHKKKI